MEMQSMRQKPKPPIETQLAAAPPNPTTVSTGTRSLTPASASFQASAAPTPRMPAVTQGTQAAERRMRRPGSSG